MEVGGGGGGGGGQDHSHSGSSDAPSSKSDSRMCSLRQVCFQFQVLMATWLAPSLLGRAQTRCYLHLASRCISWLNPVRLALWQASWMPHWDQVALHCDLMCHEWYA